MEYLGNLQVVLGLLAPLVIGMYIYKKKMVSKEFPKDLSFYLFNISLPCSILISMRFEVDSKQLFSLVWLPLICFATIFVSWGIGKLVAKYLIKDPKKRGVVEYAVMFSNFTYTAYPILQTLYGAGSIFYASIFNIGFFVGTLTLGAYVIKKSSDDSAHVEFKIKELINPPLIALFIGIILLFVKVEFPDFLNIALTSIGNTTTPMAMLMTGMIIARENSFDLSDKNVYLISAFRLILIPLMLLFILKFIGADDYMLYVPAIIVANPAAVNVVLFAENYNAPSDFGANIVVVSSILSIFTIPLINLLI